MILKAFFWRYVFYDHFQCITPCIFEGFSNNENMSLSLSIPLNGQFYTKLLYYLINASPLCLCSWQIYFLLCYNLDIVYPLSFWISTMIPIPKG